MRPYVEAVPFSRIAVRWLSAVGMILALTGVGTAVNIWGPASLDMLVSGLAVMLATGLACHTVMPVVKAHDLLEFFGHYCVLIPLIVAESVATGLMLAAHLPLNAPFSVDAAIGESVVALFVVTPVSAVVALPFAIVAWVRRARSFDPSRCQACGYRIDNLPGPRCPECGTPFDPVGDASAIP